MDTPTPKEIVERYRELRLLDTERADKLPDEIPYDSIYTPAIAAYNGEAWRYLTTDWPVEWVNLMEIYAGACLDYITQGFREEKRSLEKLSFVVGSHKFTNGEFEVIGPDDPKELLESAQNYFKYSNGNRGADCFAAKFINWNKATKEWAKTLTPIIFKGKRYLVST